MSSRKVWGVFNTLDESKLDSLSEFEIFMKIYLLNRDINLMLNYSKKHNNKDINVKALIEEQFNLEYLTYYTRKFGVEFDNEPIFGKHIEQSKSFKKWYNFWKNYLSSIDLDTYKSLSKDISLGNDISSYLPNKSWNEKELNQKEELKLLKVY